MEKLLLQEHESKQLRVERHSLKVGFEAANMTIDRMENEAVTLKQELKEQKEQGTFEHEDINDSMIGNKIGQDVCQVTNILLNINKQSQTYSNLRYILISFNFNFSWCWIYF